MSQQHKEALPESCPLEAPAQTSAMSDPINVVAALSDMMSADACPGSGINDNVVIDVMIVYTPKAVTYISGTQYGNMDALINIAMQLSNTALTNSRTGITLNLVHKHLANYTEANSSEDLYRLSNDNDNYMDEVHTLRKQHNADLVVLLPYVEFTGGLGWLLNNENGRPDLGFCLSRIQQTGWTYTMVHEIGHNMGCGHHWQQTTQAGPGLFSYSSGFRGIDVNNVKYSTIMTYESGSYFSDGQSHPRIPYFSSPDIVVGGVVIGDAVNANNVLTLKKTKFPTSRYSLPQATIGLWNQSIPYGGTEPTSESYIYSSSGLIAGDRFVVNRAPGTNVGVYPITVRIYRGDADVTCEYFFNPGSRNLTINKRTISISLTNYQSKTYTGEALTVNPGTLTNTFGEHNMAIAYSYTKGDVTTDYALDAGTYTVTASTEGDDNHNGVTVTRTFTVNKASSSITPQNKTTAYTGEPVAIDAPVTSPASVPLTITYKGTGTTVYPESETAPTGAGTYSVKLVYAGDNNYNGTTSSATLTINKAASSITAEDKETTYTGDPINIDAPVMSPASASLTITYTGTGTTVYPESETAPTNAGTYSVKLVYAGDNNYSGTTSFATLTINKASSSITAENKETTYTGDPIGIDTPITSPVDALLTITYTGTGSTDYAESTDGPVNVGTYSVKIVFAGNENYLSAEEYATLTIKSVNTGIAGTEDAVRKIKIYPSMTAQGGVITIESGLIGKNNGNLTVKVYDMSGICVNTVEVERPTASLKMPLVSGTYILKVYTKDGISEDFKVVVK
jgi:hypothetical protein